MTSDRTDPNIAAERQRMVQKQVSPDFLDPAHEWRRLFSGTWGTFLLVLVAAGGGVVAAKSNGAVALGMIVVASGLMVMVIIYFMGTVSGAHSKPEVTLAFALRRNFPRHRVPGYVLAQMMGVWRQRCFYGICLAPSAPWARARRVAVRHWRWKSC